jgi:glycerol-3-phosphate dehydrogenase
MNDLLSFDRNRTTDSQKHLPAGKVISNQELSRLLPGYDVDGSTGAAVWHDAQIYNSERLLLEFILSAVEQGAEVANYVEAMGFLRQENKILGVHARDVLTGELFEIRAQMVINCAGAWVEQLLEQVDSRCGYATSIAMNLIVDQVWSGVAAGLPSRPEAGRPAQILFFVPWRNRTMIGTWHLPWNQAPDEFKMTEEFVGEFIAACNSAYPSLKLSLDKIQHVTWGFLPVNRGNAHGAPVRLTRDGVVVDHQKKDGLSGLISVLGVKYTTARTVAEQAVDLAVAKLTLKTAKCQTHVKPVHGGQIVDFSAFLRQAIAKTPRHLNEEVIEHLVYTHGSEYRSFVKALDEPEMRQRIDPHLPVTVAEVRHAIHHERAITLPDIVQRRTE